MKNLLTHKASTGLYGVKKYTSKVEIVFLYKIDNCQFYFYLRLILLSHGV